MTPLGGRSIAASLRDFSADAGHALAYLSRRLLDPKARPLRENLLALALLAAWLVLGVPLVRLLVTRGPSAAPSALLALSLAFGLAGWVGWRPRRGSDRGRALLVLGGSGAVAWLVLARSLAGVPIAAAERAGWFLLPPALLEAALQALRPEGSRGIDRPLRTILYGVPPLLWLASRTAAPGGPALAPGLRDLIAAGLLLAFAEGVALAVSVAAFRNRRAIDRRQRGKLLAPAHAATLLAIASAALLARAGVTGWAMPLVLVAASPLAILVAERVPDLLWVDPFLRRSAGFLIALPPALLVGAGAARLSGAWRIAAVTALVLAAPLAVARASRAFERVTGRGARRRARAIARLREEIIAPLTGEEIALAARASLGEAFPGVDVALLVEDIAAGSLREAQVEDGAARRMPLQPDHPLQVYFRADDRPLSRYEILVNRRFAGARGPLLREMDELRAAALIPCRDRGTLRGLLLLGGQTRGGFFTRDEIACAREAAPILADALSRSRLLDGASVRMADLEAALDDARRELDRVREETDRAAADLEESTRHTMQAYQELKSRGSEAKQARAMLALCATPVLAGRLASRTADRMAGAMEAARPWLGETPARGRAPRLAEAQARLEDALLCARALEGVARGDPSAPSDLAAAIAQALAVLGHGRGDRIRVEPKIDEVPPVLWPRGALLSAILHLLLNAEEAIPEKGTIGIEARLVPGRALTVADAEAGSWITPGASEGKRAWASGAHRVELTIRDDGEGIARENLSGLFDPFFTTRSRAGGPGALGLGLAVVADVLSRHGGSVRVDSSPGEGTSFVLELPTAEPAPRRAAHPRR